jgi:hypothetical protein
MQEAKEVTVEQKAMEMLMACLIPTSKYFEVGFDHMQQQIEPPVG